MFVETVLFGDSERAINLSASSFGRAIRSNRKSLRVWIFSPNSLPSFNRFCVISLGVTCSFLFRNICEKIAHSLKYFRDFPSSYSSKTET